MKINNYETIRNIEPTYSEIINRDPIYSEINTENTPPPLPPRNSSITITIPLDTNPGYVSMDDREPIYEIIPPPLPPRNGMDINPCYVSIDDREPIYETLPPALPPRGIHPHTRFRELIRILDEAFRIRLG